MLRNNLARAVALALVAVVGSVGVVAATPGSGAVGTVLARGTLDAGAKVYTPDLKFKTRNDVDVVTQSITIAPGGHTGWHSHLGPSFISVVAGEATEYNDDNPIGTVYPAGSGFMDDGNHVHIIRNEGTVDLELIAFQILPKGAERRVDEQHP